MAIKYSGLRSQGELGNPFDRDEEAITALVTAGALVARYPTGGLTPSNATW